MPDDTSPNSEVHMIRGKGERVLVVEDHPVLQRSVLVLLRLLNYQAFAASDAHAAFDCLTREKIELVLVDLILPGGVDGLALARQARQQYPGLRVLLTSGLSREMARDRFGPDIDAFPLLQKPFRMLTLARSLHDALTT